MCWAATAAEDGQSLRALLQFVLSRWPWYCAFRALSLALILLILYMNVHVFCNRFVTIDERVLVRNSYLDWLSLAGGRSDDSHKWYQSLWSSKLSTFLRWIFCQVPLFILSQANYIISSCQTFLSMPWPLCNSTKLKVYVCILEKYVSSFQAVFTSLYLRYRRYARFQLIVSVRFNFVPRWIQRLQTVWNYYLCSIQTA